MEQAEHAIQISIKYILDFVLNLEHTGNGVIGIELWFDWTALLLFIAIYFFCKSVYRMYKKM